jgi:hypothetical protein
MKYKSKESQYVDDAIRVSCETHGLSVNVFGLVIPSDKDNKEYKL